VHVSLRSDVWVPCQHLVGAKVTIHISWSKEGNSSIRRYPDRKVDAYWAEVKHYRRHKACACPVPCQQRFQCEAPDHVGRRATPFCSGQADEHLSWCDACWSRIHTLEKSCNLKECKT
jgi:hypothetical protein